MEKNGKKKYRSVFTKENKVFIGKKTVDKEI